MVKRYHTEPGRLGANVISSQCVKLKAAGATVIDLYLVLACVNRVCKAASGSMTYTNPILRP